MTHVTKEDFASHWQRLLTRVSSTGERILVGEDTSEAVALISKEDLVLLQRLEDMFDAKEIGLADSEGGEIPWDSVKASL